MALTKVKGHIIADDLALGGNPTTSTQSTGNNTTRLATTAFVQTELAALGDSAPAALNTLNELAAAMGDDANFSTTVTNSIALKAPLASPALTGTVTAASHVQIAGNLDVVGQIAAYNNPGSAWGAMGFRATDYTFKNSGGTVKVAIDSSGNVGIGTTSPAQKLHVSSTGSTSNGIRISNSEGSFETRVDQGEFYLYDVDDDRIPLLIDTAGNVGIGTTSPSFKLHINKGTSSFAPTNGVTENVFGINTSYNSTGSQGIAFSRLDGNWLDGTSGADTAYGWLWNYENTVRGGLVYDHRGAERMHLFSSYGALGFITPNAADGNGVPTDSNMAERLTILPGGNVGIATTVPIATFQVGLTSDSAATAGSLVHLASSTASSTVNGFTTLKLDCTTGHSPGDIGAQIMFNQGYHGSNQDYTQPVGAIRGRKTGNSTNYGGGLQFMYQPDQGSLGILPGMTMTGTGNVGIGTDAPDKRLEVSGTDVVAKFTGTTGNPPQIEFENGSGVQATIGLNTSHDFIIDTANENVYIGGDAATLGTSILTVLSTGLVGIGTPSPTDPLTIHHGTPGIAFKDTSSNGEAYWQLDGVNVKFVNKATAGEMMFGTVNARKMALTQYGALHIDTTAGYSNKNWVNENTAASPLGGADASGNTYQKLRLWVDGDINLNQGRGIHFGDVTDAAPLCIREGSPQNAGTDQDRLEILGRKQITIGSSYGAIAPGDTSTAGTARGGAFYIKKTGQIGGTWTEVITTPNGGDQTCRVFEDWTGRWVMVGRFAADARTSIQSIWSSVRGLSTATSQSTATAFSADWGDAYPSEVRVMGCTDIDEYMDTRTIDFIYGNRPSGVHAYTPRQWKHFFAGQNADGMLGNAGGSPRFGFPVGYAYDGKGRWYNPNMHGMGMSDAITTNPRAAYTAPVSNAFNWNTALDAKLLATHYRTFASQDVYQTTGFGCDDNVQGFYDSYPTEYTNMGGGTDGGGVHAVLSSAVFILIKLHW